MVSIKINRKSVFVNITRRQGRLRIGNLTSLIYQIKMMYTNVYIIVDKNYYRKDEIFDRIFFQENEASLKSSSFESFVFKMRPRLSKSIEESARSHCWHKCSFRHFSRIKSFVEWRPLKSPMKEKKLVSSLLIFICVLDRCTFSFRQWITIAYLFYA